MGCDASFQQLVGIRPCHHCCRLACDDFCSSVRPQHDAPLRHAEFGELIRLGTDAITPLNPTELERAITRPAERVGVVVEPAVVAAIASDMVGQPTALPLMQFALTELYERRTGPSITIADYERLGGLSSALALRADGVLADLDQAQRDDARHIFLRLVTLTDGAADTRRRARLSELSLSLIHI